MCLTMIALSWRPQRGDTVNAVENVEPKLGADLTCDPRLCPPCAHSADELRESRDQPDDREPEHGIAASEILEHLDGSSVHRARAPGERTRERPACARQKRMAGSVHQRASDDGEPE